MRTKGKAGEEEGTREGGKRPRTHADQAMRGGRAVVGGGGALSFKGSQVMGITRKMLPRVRRVWDLNRPQLELLTGWRVWLELNNKRTGNKEEVLRWLHYRIRHRVARASRMLEELADKGFLIRVWYHSGANARRGHGYALSEKGGHALAWIDREFSIFWNWYVEKVGGFDCVLYMDRAGELLQRNQEVVLTAERVEELRTLTHSGEGLAGGQP